MGRDLIHDLFDRLAPAIAGEGIGIARIDDQRPRAALLHIGAAQFDLGRAADVAREDARNGGVFVQLDIGQIAAVPFLVSRAGNAGRCAGNRGQGGEGRGERRDGV